MRTSIKFGVILFPCIQKGILIHIIHFENTTKTFEELQQFLEDQLKSYPRW